MMKFWTIFPRKALDASRVRRRIEAAFAEVPYPGDQALEFQGNEDPDMEERVSAFVGRHWSEVTNDTIEHCIDCFHFFTPEAFHFYLPALMIKYLVWEEDDMVPLSFVSQLTVNDSSPERLQDFYRKVRLFHNARQCEAISLYLRYIQNNYALELFESLEPSVGYWNAAACQIRK